MGRGSDILVGKDFICNVVDETARCFLDVFRKGKDLS